eukprot:COSAG02_NODE_354_length_24016_cov_208.299231_11_plen_137_part_00
MLLTNFSRVCVPTMCTNQDCHWWHSGVRPGSVDEVTLAALCHTRHVQFNAPLFEADYSLQLIPGSHLRGTTALEREAASATQVRSHYLPVCCISFHWSSLSHKHAKIGCTVLRGLESRSFIFAPVAGGKTWYCGGR